MEERKKRLTFLVFLNAISLGAIVLLITSLLWIDSIYKEYEQDSIRIEQEHINQIRSQLKNRVDSFVKLIKYRNASIEDDLKENLKNRVYELNSLMTDLYNNNKGLLTDIEIKELMRETIRGLRYNQGRGYYFIDTLEGDVILYPVFRASEGKNLYDLQDEYGNFPLRDEIEIVKKDGHGFSEGYWKKPGNDIDTYKKIVYVQKFAPYDWYIGTGEYVDEVKLKVQAEFIQYVNQLRYGEKNEQYLFIHDNKGVQLANGVYPDLIGKNGYDLTDGNGVKIIQRQLALTSEKPFYGFLSHLWPKHNMDDPRGYYDSLTYVAGILEWNWVIGSNIDMTELQIAIEEHQQKLNQRLQSSIINIVSLMFALFAIGFFVSNYTTRRIRLGIEFFSSHIQKNSTNMNLIDHQEVQYQEFEMLATVFNQKTQQINKLLNEDDLTGLYNRRFLDRKLKELSDQPNHSQQTLAVIMLDIDHFKEVNDEFGHLVGDEALCRIASCIQDLIRKQDYVGRFGGEEILVILPDTTANDALQIAERIRFTVAALSIKEIHRSITISGGISCRSGASPEEMINEADANLYRAKKNGRNQIMV
jgi:diguanylate cyclase (GGDEF)-like protein